MSNTTHEAEITMTVEFSSGTYRIWDTDHKIPRPSDGVSRVLIRINGKFEEMFYNKVWGATAARDPKLREGTWLKQKVVHNVPTKFRCLHGKVFHLDLIRSGASKGKVTFPKFNAEQGVAPNTSATASSIRRGHSTFNPQSKPRPRAGVRGL